MTINLNHKNLFHYLTNVGLCQKEDLDNIKIDVEFSHNFNWLITLPKNKGNLVVKQTPDYSTLPIDNRIHKEWHIYNYLQFAEDLINASSLIPKNLYFDKTNSILIYKFPDKYILLKRYYDNHKDLPIPIAELVGTTLAKLHSETMNSQRCSIFMADFTQGKLQYQLPYPDYLSDYLVSPLEPESLNKTPVQAWRFIAIIQNSESVIKVIKELVLHHRHCCLTHNNIHFNNILVSRMWETKILLNTKNSDNSLIKFINWEACSWGDPACDLGKAITGYFLFWLNSMIIHPTIDMKKSIQLATIPLEVILPLIVAMIKAYISTFPEIFEGDPEFLKRVIQFAGLGLIYQLLAEFQLQPETAQIHQEIYFYIAAQLLCKPEKFLAI